MTNKQFISLNVRIKGQKDLDKLGRSLDRLAKHDGRTYKLTGHIFDKDGDKQPSKQQMSMLIKDATMPYKDFTVAQALVMQESYEGKTAFSDAVYGGMPIPARGRDSYDVYKIGQAQRLKYAIRNSSFFLSLR